MLRLALRIAALAASLSLAAPAALAQEVVVFAAASLRNALDDVIAGWAGGTAVVSYASSAALAKQIEQGAPADLFISADAPWMDYLADCGLLRGGTRRDLLGNRIVLIAHGAAEPLAATPTPDDIASLVGDERLAMANVEAVPAGRYGKASLTALGLWDGVKDRVAQAENVRAALALVARGEAPLGVVYATDAAAEAGVTVVARLPADSHPPIVYPLAVLAQSEAPAAEALAAHLTTPAARTVFERHGFVVLD